MGVLRGRWTHEHGDGIAVFLIGMRFNQPWRVDRWWPVATAMTRMLAELSRHPEWGFLAGRTVLDGRGLTVVQHWRSMDDVHAYASDPAGVHRPAWSAFNRRARAAAGAGAVGIWHETYQVAPGAAEAVYVDVPRLGLAAATSAVPVTAATSTAAQRAARRRAA